MKKLFIKFVLLALVLFIPACAFKKEKNVKKEEAIEVLRETKINGNVKVITTTETNVNGTKTTSTQTDIYYGDKYYHTSETNNLSTKTWYGKVNNILYAFYYTKNANNEEVKNSSRIEEAQLESTKAQLNSIITNLFDDSNNLLEKYEISATKKGDLYTIQVNSNLTEESDIYTITIEDNKVTKIIKNNSILSDSIKTTYEYNYTVEDFNLPTLNEYPLTTNG